MRGLGGERWLSSPPPHPLTAVRVAHTLDLFWSCADVLLLSTMSSTTTITAPDGDHPLLACILMGIREETAFTRGLLLLEVVESQALCATLEEVTNRLLHLQKPLRSSDEDVAATTTAMEDDDDTQHYVFYSPPASPTPTLPSSNDGDGGSGASRLVHG